MENTVAHRGVVEQIEEHTIYVRIARQPACAGCQAKSVCTTANGKEQMIEVTDYTDLFHVHETVLLEGKNSMEHQAVLLAFLIPLALVAATVFIGTSLQWGEGFSALAGLLLLFPYYIILYFFRDTWKKKFVFTIKKINPE
jgi:sigma-E factor negative regulatory protein RseC